jgi:UDP-N-acetylmuramate--alanine ligase
MLVDDYAHHPTAIQVTLEAARHRYPDRRLIAVYQPHMYSRTRAFFAQFLRAFDAADITILSDIFPAREHDTGLIHTRDLVAALQARGKGASERLIQTDDAADRGKPYPAYVPYPTGLIEADPGSGGRPFPTSQNNQVLYGGSVAETADLLTTIVETGDLVVIMGAGDIYMATEQLLHDSSRETR